MRLALCGNPNVGKTTLFNRLTHSDAPVGNWHGVTVDIKEKRVSGERGVVLCDLPGAYSLTARSDDERAARDVILGGVDAVVYVAEANDRRRNLYLFMQVLESGARAVLVVNMMDEARGKLDLAMLSARLGVPVVGTSQKYPDPKREILEAVSRARAVKPPYCGTGEVARLAREIDGRARTAGLEPAFAALKLMERDEYIGERIGRRLGCGTVCAGCAACDSDAPARMRYEYIDSVLSGAVCRPVAGSTKSGRLDRIVCGRAALPVFLLVMTAVFVITYEAGKPLSALAVRLMAAASERARETMSAPEWVVSLICDGVLTGVGSVLAFLPQTALLFVLTALLQDSGYMSRVAFVTDGFFRRFGLSGRAAFSLILGLGCSATAVLTARGMSDKTAAARTALITPFVPCSARLAVFVAITSYLGLPGIAIAGLYVLGLLAALGVLGIMRAAGGARTEEPLLMEMPPYRLPSAKRVLRSACVNVWAFIVRVGTTVLCVSVIMWVLSDFSIGYGYTGGSENSVMNTFAGFIAPVFAPLGFGDWRAVAALISGVAAKETVISVIASLGGMSAVFASREAAVSFLIFSGLYVPCAATLAVIAKECGIKAAALSVCMHTAVAYLAAFAYYACAVWVRTDIRLFVTAAVCAATACAGVAVYVRFCRAARKKRAAAQT